MKKGGKFGWAIALVALLALSLGEARPATAGIINGGGIPPVTGPAPGEALTGLAAGLFMASQTDLSLPGPMPIALTRTYRSRDVNSSGAFIVRPFGLGTNFNYGIFLYSESEAASAPSYTSVDVVLPDGGRLICNRFNTCSQSGCTDYADAVFRCQANPGPLYGALITYNAARPGWDLRRKDGTVFAFGQGAPLQSITDRHGNQITLVRNGGQSGDITRISSSNGRYIDLSYADLANPHQVTKAVDNSGRTATYTYDAQHRMTSMTDANGNTTSYTYQSAATQLGDIAGATDALGNAGNVTYDAALRLSALSGALGSYSFAYTTDVNGRITACDVTDPRSFKRHLTYNAAGYVATDTRGVGQPEQQLATNTRDATSNLLLSVTDQLNRKTSFVYDGAGNLTSIARLAGTAQAVTTSAAYEPNFNQLASVTDPLGHIWSAGFDLSGNAISVTDPLGHATGASYNSLGQPLSVTDPLGNTTRFTYNGSADVASVADPLGNATTLGYDPAGRLTRVTDPLRNATSFAYDAQSRLTKVTDPNGAATSYAYDAIGDLTTVTDANGASHITNFSYVFFLGSKQRCDALNQCETSYFDGLNNLTSFTDARGLTYGYSYDALNRLTTASFNTSKNPSFSQSSFSYTYDGGDRLTTASGGISRSYDGLDRLLSETTPQGTVTYSYDAAGRRTAMTAGSQAQTIYTYDAANRLTAIARGAQSVAIAYDNDNRRTSLTLPNGVVVTYAYDAASRLTALTYQRGATVLGTLTYSYDADSRRLNMGGSFARLKLPVAATATYDAANRVYTWNGALLSHDAAGNLLNDPVTGNALSWDAISRLSSIASPSSTFPFASFTYDAFGRRTTKGVEKNISCTGDVFAGTFTCTESGSWISFLYDGLNPVQEQSYTTTNFVAGPTTKADLLTGLGLDELFTRTDSSGTLSVLADALGSTLALADSAGNMPTSYTYAPFGDTTVNGIASASSFQFTGRENDATSLSQSSLYYLRNRYYSPTLQRFISPDPLRFGGGDVNLYAYVHNSPANLADGRRLEF